MKELKEREKETRREYILDEAGKCFRQQGFDEVSMEDIAKEVGINRTTLYLYFKDRESLFFAIVLRGFRVMHAMMMEAGSNARDPLEKVLEMGDAMAAFMEQHPDDYRLQRYFLSGRFDLSDCKKDKTLAEICRLRKEIYARFSAIIKEGIESKTFRDDIHPLEIAILVCNFLNAATSLSSDAKRLLVKHDISENRFHRDVRQMIANMIKNPDM